MNGAAGLTVVIPFHRSLPTISRALDSALSQCDGRIRIIVVIDDCSHEAQGAIEARNDRRIAVVTNERNLGAPASRNRGLALVTTPYVSFLDADDYFEGDLLGPLAARMQQEGAQIGFGPTVHLNPGRTRRHGPNYRDHEDVFVRWFSGIQNVHTASVVWLASYLRSIGGWDESIRRNQDGEVALRAILLGARYSCSFEGAGVWVNNEDRPRITGRTDNLDALTDVVMKFERLHSDVVSDEARLRACACQLRKIAVSAYRSGELTVAADAMDRRRRLGFEGPRVDTERLIALALRPFSAEQRGAAYRVASQLKRSFVPRGTR